MPEVKASLLAHLDLSLAACSPASNPAEAQPSPLARLLRNTPTKGIVLYGPPGTGKTQLARAVAALRAVCLPASLLFSRQQVPLKLISLEDILCGEMGEAEARLRRAFQVQPPAVLFVDELQALFISRDGPFLVRLVVGSSCCRREIVRPHADVAVSAAA
jgi:SpoVK/Ycf46/Vps4 family AAA+-type ATPase